MRATVLCALLSIASLGQATEITPTTSDGTLPGSGIGYTISSDGSARSIWSPGVSDRGLWFWNNGFPEFVSVASQTLTVEFDAPVQLRNFTLGVNSISNGAFTLTLSGGSASVTDFDLADGIAVVGGFAEANYDPVLGIFDADRNDASLMIGSTSRRTVTGFTLSGNNAPDGYTLFFAPVASLIFTDSFEVASGF